MTLEAALAALAALSPAVLASAYSGRPGCACGCRGRYRYASAHREWAGRNRGYAVDDDDVSDRSVARILDNARAAAAAGWRVEAYADDAGRVTTVSVETDTRLYILSPVPSAA